MKWSAAQLRGPMRRSRTRWVNGAKNRTSRFLQKFFVDNPGCDLLKQVEDQEHFAANILKNSWKFTPFAAKIFAFYCQGSNLS